MRVYHGTTPQQGRQYIVSGIDAHIPYERAIHGPQDNYAGIFVTPKISVARRHGLCVIAIDIEDNLLTVPPNLAIEEIILEQSLNHHFEPQAFLSVRIEPTIISIIECRDNGYLLNPFVESINDITSDAAELLNNEEAALETQLLLQHLLNVNRAWLIAHQNDALEANIHEAYRALINRRINGEPIAYILGYREFYGLKLKVTPDTLIPRPDTETLVDAALEKIAPNLPLSICDLGTGTGAIALAIAKNRPQANVTAVDFSDKALEVARQNAQDLMILNCQFLQSDWLSALKLFGQHQRFDVIVSNPPYIKLNDAHLQQGDLRFEPLSALASGKDGLDDIRTIIRQAINHLNPYGWLMLEHGYNQAEAVASLFKEAGYNDISHALDLQGIQRVSLGRLI